MGDVVDTNSRQGAPFVGRSQELARLRAVLDQARSGRGGLVVVEAAAGLGKTRLVSEALADAHDFRVVISAAEEFARHRPFSAVAEALMVTGGITDLDRTALAELLGLPAHRGAAGEVGYQVLELVLSVVERLASRQPVAVVLEDLHWADTSTLRALRAMARRCAELPLAVLATVRRFPHQPPLAALLGDLHQLGGELLPLAPLPPELGTELAAELAGGCLGPRLRRLVASVGGDPLFLTELIGALRCEDQLTSVDNQVETRMQRLPHSLRALVRHRLEQLSADTAQVLQIAAVFGGGFTIDALATVAGRPVVQLLPALREATTAGLIDEAAEQLTFRHALIRHAIYDELPLAVRRSLHREAGRALAADGASAVRVAAHLAQSASQGDVEAVEWLRSAGREAAPRSVPEAVELFERAAALTRPDYPGRDALIAELAPLLALSGRVDEAEQRIAEVLARAPSVELELRLRLGMMHALARQARWSRAREQAITATARLDDPVRRAMVQGPAAFISVVMGDLDAAHQLAGEALGAAEQAGKPVAAATALMALSWVVEARGDCQTAAELAHRAVEVTRDAGGFASGFLFPQLCLGTAQMGLDRPDQARETFESGVRRAEALGTPTVLPYYRSGLAVLGLHTGDWPDALRQAEAAVAFAEDGQTHFVQVPLAVDARIRVARGDLAGAASAVQHAEREAADRGPMLGADWALWVKALCHEARGDLPAAADTIATAWQLLPELHWLYGNWAIAADAVRLALAVGDRTLAESVTKEIEAAATSPSATAAGLRCRGLLHTDGELLVAAARAYQQVPRPYERATAYGDAARALATAGQLADARPLFDEAMTGFETLGARHDAARLAAAMRDGGIRRGVRGTRRRVGSGWDALTQTERTVVALITEGLTNREIAHRLFISRHTVDTHLKHLRSKLGIASRSQIAAEAVRQSQPTAAQGR
ncbi:MAG: AAA family ATPase [Micromonosporaceae bacterium]|nr:AAA family ATPase [Micromonosporaceae bacterium]